MYVTIVDVIVKEQNIDDFINATRINHENSIKEEGNMRFDILQSPEHPTHFILYEAYQTQQHAAAHKKTVHYAAWRETVADWMAQPRNGVVYNGLYPK
jgi:autoinducer 2-degrading protein